MKELTFSEGSQRAKAIAESLIAVLKGKNKAECLDELEDFKTTHNVSEEAENFILFAIMQICSQTVMEETPND